jgi:hypothetical protein
MDDVRLVQSGSSSIVPTMLAGVGYMAAVLVGAYQAIRNLARPGRGYLFLLVPLLLIVALAICKFRG